MELLLEARLICNLVEKLHEIFLCFVIVSSLSRVPKSLIHIAHKICDAGSQPVNNEDKGKEGKEGQWEPMLGAT